MPEVSIIVTITRHWALEKLFYCLDNLITPTETEVILYIDTDDDKVINSVSQYVDNCKFNVNTIISGNSSPNEIRIKDRRDRISNNHNDLKKYINGEYVLEFEDDTVFPEDSLVRLLKIIKREDVGFVQGVQVGRWGYRMIGVWKVNNISNPTKIITYPFTKIDKVGDYVEGIDAGGFYCYMTKASLFKEHEFTWHDECFGPDVSYGLSLKNKGFKNYVIWNLLCGHNIGNAILYPDDKVVQIEYNKINDRWILKPKTLTKQSKCCRST